MVRKSKIKIVYENIDISREIVGEILSISATDNLNSVDDISISIKDTTRKWMDSWNPQKGDTISAFVIGENWDKEGDYKELPLGKFSIDELIHSGPPQIININGISYDLSGGIKENIKNRAWENIDLKTIAREICTEANIELYMDIEANIIPRYNRIEQNEETDLSLLKRLCELESLTLKTQIDKIIIFDERVYEGHKSILNIKHTNSLNYNIQSNDLSTYDSCIVTYFDSKLKKTITGSFTPTNRKGYKKSTGKILRIKEGEGLVGTTETQRKEELNKRAQNYLRGANKSGIIVSINDIKNSFDLWAGAMITLLDFGVYSGRYLITNISRDISDKSTMSLSLQKELGY